MDEFDDVDDHWLAVARRQVALYGIAEHAFKAWRAQAESAVRRGIPFRFSLFEWDQWWKRELIVLGPDAKRGRRKGAYMMARFKDQGAYEHGNVYAATAAQNANDIPPEVRIAAQRKADATLAAHGVRRGDHLRIGSPHPSAHAVMTPLGRYASIRLASVAHGISERTGRYRVRRGYWTLE
jgi:hypothetical protein